VVGAVLVGRVVAGDDFAALAVCGARSPPSDLAGATAELS
jgi:hypothetical protein